MAVRAAQVQVGTSPVELTAAPTDWITGSALLVQAPASATLFVGGDDVTAQTGYPLTAGQVLSIDLDDRERLFGVLASGSGTVYVLRSGL